MKSFPEPALLLSRVAILHQRCFRRAYAKEDDHGPWTRTATGSERCRDESPLSRLAQKVFSIDSRQPSYT